ncbi:MAG: hypothetical protein H6698_09615 [Myxococcales bacterium]|nr:hypothetical protein [Myxococcales bacterium]MCB9532637.1 hypothetical protein [Myxococcales bacterium]MCB9534539.1 hypothetical protein [Myxococcales bacterium]
MRVDGCRAALKTVVESTAADVDPRRVSTLRVVEAGQRDVRAPSDGVVTIKLTAGPSRYEACYAGDVFDVEFDLTAHFRAAPNVEDRAGMVMERLGARLCTAVGGGLDIVETGDPSAPVENDGQVEISLPVRCIYRVGSDVINNTAA